MSERDDEAEPSRRGAVMAVAVILAAIVAAIFVVRQLHQAAGIQDCVMSGRTNCARIESPAR